MSTQSNPELPTGKIHTQVAAIMSDVSHIGKDQTNNAQHFKFRGIEDVMNALHDLFKIHSVVIYTEIVNHEMKEFTTSKGGVGYHHLSRVNFHLTADDGSVATIASLGEAMDYGDKGATKTLSIALKYALLNLFLIPTKETSAEDADRTSHQVVKAPKPTPAAVAEAKAKASAEAHWFELKWPFGKPEKYAGGELATVAAAGDVESLEKMKGYFVKLASEETPHLTGYILKIDNAITEAKSVEGKAQGGGYQRPDPNTGEADPEF